MFTLIEQYKKLFMAGVTAYLSSLETSSAVVEDQNNKDALKAMIESIEFATVSGVTKEMLQSLDDAHNLFKNGGKLEKGVKGPEVKDIQEMMLYLGYDISYTSKSRGEVEGTAAIDGDFGTTMVNVTKKFQENNGLTETGVIDRETYIKILQQVATKGGVSATNASIGDNSEANRVVSNAVNRAEESQAAQVAISDATTLTDLNGNLATAHSSLQQIISIIGDRGYPTEIDEGVLDTLTLAQAQQNFDAAKANYRTAYKGNDVSLAEQLGNTSGRLIDNFYAADNTYYQAALILAHMKVRDAAARLEEIDQNSQEPNPTVVLERHSLSPVASPAPDIVPNQALTEDTDPQDAVPETLTEQDPNEAIILNFDIDTDSKNREKVVALQQALIARDSKALPRFGADGDFGGETRGALNKARSEITVRKNNEFNAAIQQALNDNDTETAISLYIESNSKLKSLHEENPEKVEELIEGMLYMDAASIGGALSYFGQGVELGAITEMSGDLIVAVIEYANSEEGIRLSSKTAEYIVRLNTAYQEKANELGAAITALNTKRYLSTGYYAAENHFNTSLGIPSLELVMNSGEVIGINNGFQGRIRCHTHTTYTSHTEHTDMTTRSHHTNFVDGQLVSSTHSGPSTDRIGSVTTNSVSSSHRRWFEKYPGGIDRDAMSALIASGQATLRPSYELMQRLFEPSVSEGNVTLKPVDWYSEMLEWQTTLAGKHTEGEMAIVNRDMVITSKTMSGAMTEVLRKNPKRHGQIMAEVRDNLASSEDFSFLLWDNNANKKRGNAIQLLGHQQEDGSWTVVRMNPNTDDVIERQEFASSEDMLNSTLGEKAIEMSSYRYLGVVNTTTDGGLRIMDDQGLIRCGNHEKVVLLDEPAPVLPQGYNFIRTGLPCGVLGAYCTSSSSSRHTENIRNLERDIHTSTRRTTPRERDESPSDPVTPPIDISRPSITPGDGAPPSTPDPVDPDTGEE